MEQFVFTPNCPDNRVSLVAAGDYPEITRALINEGIRVISVKNPLLNKEVSSHSDMILCHAEKNTVFIDPSQDKDIFTREGFRVFTSSAPGRLYPEDVKLNVAVSRDFFLCNKKTADKALLSFLSESGKKEIDVKQGYTKCSVCFVTENAVITEDPSIKATLENSGIDVLEISKGDIYLSESHYGFFGGSTGKISKDTLAVTGELKYHRDAHKISDFCRKHGVRIKELKKGRIIDIGGILPLKEVRL